MKRMNKFRLKKTEKNLFKILFKVSLVVFCVCLGLQFYFSNKYAVKNDSLQAAIEEQAVLKKELAHLKYEDSLLSSLEYVESEAEELGFVGMEQNLLTVGPVTVASLSNR